jgi:hypothetical protein
MTTGVQLVNGWIALIALGVCGPARAVALLVAAQFAGYGAIYLAISLRLGGVFRLFQWMPFGLKRYWRRSARKWRTNRACLGTCDFGLGRVLLVLPTLCIAEKSSAPLPKWIKFGRGARSARTAVVG